MTSINITFAKSNHPCDDCCLNKTHLPTGCLCVQPVQHHMCVRACVCVYKRYYSHTVDCDVLVQQTIKTGGKLADQMKPFQKKGLMGKSCRRRSIVGFFSVLVDSFDEWRREEGSEKGGEVGGGGGGGGNLTSSIYVHQIITPR